jgi:hypothetical protein
LSLALPQSSTALPETGSAATEQAA